MKNERPYNYPIAILSRAEQAQAITSMHGSNRQLSEAQICKATSAGVAQKEAKMYAEGWRNEGFRNVKKF
jgi:hypothetical protein